MAFDSLSDKLQNIFKKLRGKGRLNEDDVKAAMKEVKMCIRDRGSIAMEIIKELPTVDYILVPIGGGGLATGVSTLAKMLNPNIKVIGVEPAGANCMQVSLKNGKVTTLPAVNTIADGTAVKTPGSRIFPYIQQNIDDIITIEDNLSLIHI